MWNFVKQFILHPRRTGAIMPSSPDLAKAMLAPVDFTKAKHIVELGPGTGAFTHLILKKMKPDCKLTAIELNKDFCKHLSKINDPRLKIINDNAVKLSSYVDSADYVISGLPLIGFPKNTHNEILQEIKKITKNAYIQFHYSPLGESYLKKHFNNVTKKMALKNIPPAIVYISRQ